MFVFVLRNVFWYTCYIAPGINRVACFGRYEWGVRKTYSGTPANSLPPALSITSCMRTHQFESQYPRQQKCDSVVYNGFICRRVATPYLLLSEGTTTQSLCPHRCVHPMRVRSFHLNDEFNSPFLRPRSGHELRKDAREIKFIRNLRNSQLNEQLFLNVPRFCLNHLWFRCINCLLSMPIKELSWRSVRFLSSQRVLTSVLSTFVLQADYPTFNECNSSILLREYKKLNHLS